MGKGDKKTKRGKIIAGSFGKSRPHKLGSYQPTAKPAAKKEDKPAAKAKKPAAKKAAAKKPAAKKTAAKKTTAKKAAKK